MMRRKILAALVVAILLGGVWFWRTRRDPVAGGMSPTRFLQLPHAVGVVKFVADGRFLMLGSDSEDGAVTFLDLKGDDGVRSWQGGGNNIWVGDDGKNALTMSYGARANKYHYVLRDALNGASLRQWTDKGRAESVARDLSVMVVIEGNGNNEYRGRVIEVVTGLERGKFEAPGISWNSVRLSRSARYLSVSGGGKDIPATLLSMDDLQPVLELPPLRNVFVSNDEKRVIGIDGAGTIHFWQLPAKRHSTVATGLDRTNWIYEIFDGSLVIDGSRNDKSPEGQNARSSSPALQVRSEDGTEVLHEFNTGATKTFSTSGRFIGFQAPRPPNSASGNANVYDIYDISHLANFQRSLRIDARFDVLGQPLTNSFYSQENLAIDEDGRRVAYATSTGLVRIYDVDKGGSGYRSDLVTTLGGRVVALFGGGVMDAMVLPDGGIAALGNDSQNAISMQVVQADGKTVKYSDREAYSSANNFGLSFKGGGLNNPFSFDREEKTQTYQGATFLLASKTVAPDTNSALLLWNRATKVKGKDKGWSIGGQGLIEIRSHDDRVVQRLKIVRSAGSGMRGALGAPTWSSDSKMVALTDELGMVYLWNATNGQNLGRLTGARTKVTGYTSSFVDNGFGRISPLAFSPDNRHLVAGRDDGSLYVYSLQTLLPVAQMGQAQSALRWLRFAPDGLTLYGIAVNGKSVLAWPMPNPLP